MDTGKPVSITKFELSDNGRFQFYDEKGNLLTPEAAFGEGAYDRKKGPKALNQVPFETATSMKFAFVLINNHSVVKTLIPTNQDLAIHQRKLDAFRNPFHIPLHDLMSANTRVRKLVATA